MQRLFLAFAFLTGSVAGFAVAAPMRTQTAALSSPAAALAAATTVATAPIAPALSADVSQLLSSAVSWGMSRCGDDAMLALVSPHAYWLLRDWRRKTFGDLDTSRRALEGVRRALVRAGASEADVLRGASVQIRTKGLWSTFLKSNVRQQQVHDVLAVRVVLRKSLTAEDCFRAHEAVRAMWPSQPGRHKDYVSAPKANGYRAVHDTMRLPSGHSFEIQIRSADAHREAEFGLASHRKYKGNLVSLPMAIMAGMISGVALAKH